MVGRSIISEMRRMRLLSVFLCLAAWATTVAGAQGATIVTFYLEETHGNRTYGPFLFKEGATVLLDSSRFDLLLGEGRAIRFRSQQEDKVYGPYELKDGRIVILGDDAYVVRQVHPLETQEQVTRKEPTTPVSSGKRVKSLPPENRKPPPVTIRRVPQQRTPRTPGHAGKRLTAPPRAVVAPRRTQVGMACALIESKAYDREVQGDDDSSVSLERNRFSVFLSWRAIRVDLGLTMSGQWDDEIERIGESYDNVDLSDGEGWFMSARVEHPIWIEGAWSVEVAGSLSYLSEDYRLSYERWSTREVTLAGTGGVDVVHTEWIREDVGSDATLTEWELRAGGVLSYEINPVRFYAGLEIIPWVDTQFDGAVRGGEATHEIHLDTVHPVAVYGGVEFTHGGFHISLEGEEGSTSAIRLGIGRDL